MRRVWDRVVLWLAGRVFIVTVILWINVFRRRMSHNNGVAGRGKLRIVTDQKFPASDFFEPGREFPCRIRHGAAGYMDDAMAQVRSGSLKFADSTFSSPLDLQMNTGRHCFFWNAASFLEFVWTRIRETMMAGGNTDNIVHYLHYHKKYADGRKSAADASPRTPKSNALMYYFSQTPFDWRAKDGVPRYVRFRLIPGDRSPEDPPVNPAWVAQVRDDPKLAPIAANQRAVEGETRTVNYLKEEWTARIKAGPIRHLLQIQWHDVRPDDPDVIRNPLEPWDEASHPWADLAEVEITDPLSYEEQDQMAFEVTNLPPCMDLLPATSIRDYNSLNYMRKFAVWSIRARWFFTRLFGRPKPFTDADARKVRNKRPPGI
jgi:arachidonate 5-lipoxygenase